MDLEVSFWKANKNWSQTQIYLVKVMLCLIKLTPICLIKWCFRGFGCSSLYVPSFMLYFMHFSRWWSYQIVFTLTFPIRVLSSPKNFTAHHQNDWLLIRPEPIVLLHNVISKWMKYHIRKLLFLRWVQVTSKLLDCQRLITLFLN